MPDVGLSDSPHYAPVASVKYSDVAGPNVPPTQRHRRDRVLFTLRSATGPVTADELVEHLQRNRLRDYNYGLCCKDLAQLERYHFVRSAGHPKRWEAVC